MTIFFRGSSRKQLKMVDMSLPRWLKCISEDSSSSHLNEGSLKAAAKAIEVVEQERDDLEMKDRTRKSIMRHQYDQESF